MYGRKCEALCEALRSQFGNTLQFHRPEGGMFVWARIEGIDASELLQRAIDNKVMFVPGKAFFADRIDPASLRLSFAAPGIADIEEGAKRI
jgi:DNA-binding transcriptional MocR family regulator